ncbi:hypothetical protein C0V77_11840 [Emticicia sp. TH156]|nr:hypothetical protein C0V77_11840 [Emticicia sp. TH156]
MSKLIVLKFFIGNKKIIINFQDFTYFGNETTIIKKINNQTVKKILLILSFALATVTTSGQFYLPNGKKINTKGKTIAAVLDSLGVSETNTHSRSNTILLTALP